MTATRTSEEIKYHRRRFLGVAAMGIAAAEFGMTGFAHPQASTTAPADATTFKPAANISFASQGRVARYGPTLKETVNEELLTFIET